MASKPDEVHIKVEANSSMLQSYLSSFNKEIEVGEQSSIHILQDEGTGDDDFEEGTYFVDESGNYYYKATKDSKPVLTAPPEELDDYIDDDEQSEDIDYVSEMHVHPNKRIKTEKKNVKVVQTGSNTDEEISYVLIVGDGDNQTPTKIEQVYEFNENEEEEKSMDIDDKSKIIKLVEKKPQVTTAVHMCNYCNYSTPKRYLLARHMKCHSEERPHKCSVCERGFKTLASLQNHINTHTGNKPHRCKYCESSFTTSGELVRHVRYRHTHEKPHKCDRCDYASVELSKLKRHVRCHTGERPYQCPHCTYASPDTFKLKRHLRIHTGEKPYKCDICQARFTQSNSLKAHKLIHSVGDKPVFQCELCPTTCGRKTDLRIHVQKLHTSERPLKCKRCEKSFPDRYSYKVHSKTHEGEKCYKCELCPYASISARHLESHILIHTDQKPFSCDQCDQAFRQKQLLKRHINLYHNKDYVPPPPREKTHVCPHCDRCFRHKGNLIRHMTLHDPESNVKTETNALKAGRMKRVQVINGQRIEIISDGDDHNSNSNRYDMHSDIIEDDNELDAMDIKEEKNMVAVEDDDGQQFVVLELVEDDDNDEGEFDSLTGRNERYVLPDPLADVVNPRSRLSSQKILSDKSVDKYFDFGDDQNDSDDEQYHKSTIKLLPMSK